MTAPPDWVRCTLDDIRAPDEFSIAGGPFGSDLVAADYVADGVPVIRGCNLGHGERRFYPDDLVFVRPAKADALRRSLAVPGDVVFTQRGTVGQVGLVPDDLPWPRYLLSQSQMKLTCDKERADPEFIYYWCRAPELQAYLAACTISAGVPHINLGALRKAPLLLPPLPEQRAIARVGALLDRRISLCDDQRARIAAVIDVLFRTWFISHEPVTSKRDGERHPSVDAAAHALFPDRLDDHGVPLGYTRAALPTLAEFQNGTPFTLADFCPPDDGLPVIKIAELKRGITGQTRHCRERDGARSLQRGDLLLSWSGNPDTSIDVFLYAGGPAWLNQHIYKIVPPSPSHRAYLYGLLRSLLPVLRDLARARQTTGLGHVSMKDLRGLQICVPPPPLIDAFDRLTAPYFAELFACADLSATLARTRDALLPRLVTGEARIDPPA